MARIVTPGTSSSEGSNYGPSRPFFATDLVRRYGLRGVLAIVVAAVLAFAPLGVLYWFNELRLQPVATLAPGQRAVVKPARHRGEQEREEPGETALLQVICEVPSFDGWQELMQDEDPSRPDSPLGGTYVRRELVYLRRAGSELTPFGLLGPPPVSVWLPAGDYEILVVHESPGAEQRTDSPARAFPWLSVFTECTLEGREKTVCRVPLPHYDWGSPDVRLHIGEADNVPDHASWPDELAPVVAACETVIPLPTPGGYVLALDEPRIHHRDDHHDCVQDYRDLHAVPREWTRDQIAALRNWLPGEATAAKGSLSRLVDRLLWREFLQGWFCYAAAGITGLVFTRFGAIALVEPWRRGDAWRESLGLLVQIFFFSVAAWFVFQIMTDSSGCRGPLPFRMH